MKTIILMRHSIQERLNLPTEQLPLSEDGRRLASERKLWVDGKNISKCFCSPYLRARETADIICKEAIIVNELHERIVGDSPVNIDDFWIQQYLDYDYKNNNGESLNEVRDRMLYAMNYVVASMEENTTALVVSHATAICSYLSNYCKIEVTDIDTKKRRITYKGQEIMDSQIRPTDYFVLQYDNNNIKNIFFNII